MREYDRMHYFEYCCNNHRESLSVFKFNHEREPSKINKYKNNLNFKPNDVA